MFGAQARRVRLNTAVYNPLSLTSPFRLGQIALTLRADIVFLPGTTLRPPEGTKNKIIRLGAYWAISFGWKRGPFVNKAAGCAVLFRAAKSKTSDVVSIKTPTDMLIGRGVNAAKEQNL